MIHRARTAAVAILCPVATINFIVFLATLASAALASEVSFDSRQVIARGVTPHASVLFFGVASVPLGYESRLVRTETIVNDDDGDGIVSLPIAGGVPVRSVWFVVDFRDWSVAAGKPTTSPAEIKELLPSDFSPHLDRGDSKVSRFTSFMELLLVRPGRGVWVQTAGDGGPSDDDGAPNGVVTVLFSRMRSVGNGPTPPSEPAAGDILVAIDINNLKAALTRVTGR